MHVFLTGPTGFVGSRVLDDLLAAGHQVTALAHSNRSRVELQRVHPEVQIVIGNAAKPGDMRGIMPQGVDAIVYLPGLLREFPKRGKTFQAIHVDGVRNLLAEAKRVGAQRWIQMSALGVSAEASTGYFHTKWQAEELVRQSGLDWTILRPSVVFDDRPTKQINFVGELAKVIAKTPVVPVFGDGEYRMQPVSLDDVSQTVVQSLAKPETIGKTYELGGPEKLPYIQILRLITKSLGKQRKFIHIPFWAAELMAVLLQRFSFFPFTLDQLTMLKEENVIHDAGKEREWREMFELPMKRIGRV
jgi:uncharacterized protein YbjT (DUF2867 family)